MAATDAAVFVIKREKRRVRGRRDEKIGEEVKERGRFAVGRVLGTYQRDEEEGLRLAKRGFLQPCGINFAK